MCVWLKDSLNKLKEIHLPEISFWYWIYLQKRLYEHPVTSMDFPLDFHSLSEPLFATKGKDQLNSQLIEFFVSWQEQSAFVCSGPSCLMLRKVKLAVTSTSLLELTGMKRPSNAAFNQCFRETGMQQDDVHVPGRKQREIFEGILPRGCHELDLHFLQARHQAAALIKAAQVTLHVFISESKA